MRTHMVPRANSGKTAHSPPAPTSGQKLIKFCSVGRCKCIASKGLNQKEL